MDRYSAHILLESDRFRPDATMISVGRGLNVRNIYYSLIRPLGIIRRMVLKYASMGQVLVPPTKTWAFQRDHFLKNLGISLAIDVGGNLGQWALEARKISKVRIVTFEPDPRCHHYLDSLSAEDPTWEIVQKAAGNTDSTVVMNLLKIEHGYSSLKDLTRLGENFSGERIQEIDSHEVQVGRLDTHFKDDITETDRVWLKIDVQGYEEEVLEGAIGILANITAVEIEIPMLKLYENSAKVSTIVKFFEDQEFVLCSIFSDRWSKNGVADCDALFVKAVALNEFK